MWAMIALVMSLALFSLLSLTHMEQDENSVYQSALSAMEIQSAQQMDTFASAAWAYATANAVSTGVTISVGELISAGYLPTAFAASNPFDQTLTALTGNNTLAAFYQNPPNTLYGVPVVPGTEKGVAMAMAEKLSAMQENAPLYVAAISYNGGSGAYTQALLPFAATALTMSTNDPQFSTTFPSLLDLVNVLPATGLSAGSGSGATAAANSGVCGTPVSYTTPGTYQVTVPSCAVSADVTAVGAGGSGSEIKVGGAGSSVSGTVAVSANGTLTVVVGGGGTWSVGGGGGGLSAVCNGTSCSSSSALVVAGGGGGAGYWGNGGNAGTSNQSAGSADGGTYSGGNGGDGFGGYGNDAYNYHGTAGTPFAAGGSGNNSGGYGATGNGGYGGGGGGGGAYDGGGGGGGGFPGGGGSGTGPSIGGYGGQGGEDLVPSGGTTGTGAAGGATQSNGANGSVSITFIN